MKIIRSFIVICLSLYILIPDRVYAETPSETYKEMQMGCNIIAYDSTYEAYYKQLTEPSVMPRGFIYHQTQRDSYSGYVVYVENARKTNNAKATSGSCAAYSGSGTQSNPDKTYDGHSFGFINLSITYATTFNLPVIEGSTDITNDLIYRYTFGDLAVGDAVDPVNYGSLILKGYKTDIAGSGNAAVNNKDTISWEPVDTNGNDITSCQVRIRAIPGQYTAESKTTLLQKLRTDFITDVLHASDLGVYPAREESHSYTWGHVIDVLELPFLGITSLLQRDNTWIKNGWIYQIRLEDEESGYVGEWQTVYTATAAGVENDLTVINSTTLNQELINVITSINESNNVTNNWTIINIIIIPNPEPTPTPEPGTDPGGNSDWFSALLQAIVSLISGILSFLGNMIGDLIDAIVSLFQPDEFTINNFNEYKLELKQNSGIFGQAIDFTTTLKNTFLGVQYQEPIIHWQGISFGETELIPAADYNLNDYVTMWGLGDFRTMAYLCSDGFIYFSLLILIVRKLNEVLKK